MKNTTIFGIACAAVALFLGYELVEERKTSKRKEETYKVDLEREAEKVSREIEQGAHDRILDKAITDAANRMVEDILKKASNRAVEDTKRHMYGEINTHVRDEWTRTRDHVADIFLEKARKSDTHKLEEAIVDAARDALLDELSDKLEEAADKVNEKYEKKAEKIANSYEEKFKNRMQYRYGMFF